MMQKLMLAANKMPSKDQLVFFKKEREAIATLSLECRRSLKRHIKELTQA